MHSFFGTSIDVTVILFGTSFFLTGRWWRKSGLTLKIWLSLLLFVSSITISLLTDINMEILGSSGIKIFFIYIVANFGILATISLSNYITGKIADLLDYVGKYTLEILTFHFLALKIISLIAILYYGFDIAQLSSHPVIKDLAGLWWIAYTIVGTIVPILIANGLKYPKRVWHNARLKQNIELQ